MAKPTRQEIIAQALQWVSWYKGRVRFPAKPRVMKGKWYYEDEHIEPSNGWFVTVEVFISKGEFDD